MKTTIAILMAGLVLTSTGFAQSADSDKLDLKTLEDKYWSGKDTDVTVVQNRTYTKALRPYLSLTYGPLVNDAYSYGRNTALAIGYYYSERWGAELNYESGSLKNSDSTNAFFDQNGFAPNYNTMQKYLSANVTFVPFYAKMSFMDRSIMYFDIQFALGVGQMTYKVQTLPSQRAAFDQTSIGFNFDITQQLFFDEHFAFRLDVKNKWTPQDRYRYRLNSNEDESARKIDSLTQQDTSILFGITYFY